MFLVISIFGAIAIYGIWFSEFNLSVVISGMILIIVGFIMWKRLDPNKSN
jgi:glucose uptake protein GlcU